MASRTAARAYLGLGGNLGDRAANIDAALRRIGDLPRTRILTRSSLYETAPWGEPDQPPFLNAAAAVETTLGPYALLDGCLAIETELGRERGRRWGPRTIDIDLLAYEGITLDEPRLTLPHPRLLERAFALVPLAEIAPDLDVGSATVGEAVRRVGTSGVAPWTEGAG